MSTLDAAHKELFRRTPDETYESMEALFDFCQQQKEGSTDRWEPPSKLKVKDRLGNVSVSLNGDDESLLLNDWSFQ